MQALADAKIGIIGLGYVGLPLAVGFGSHYPVVGFDVDAGRIAALQRGEDSTRETTPEELAGADQLSLTTAPEALATCTVYIVTVPTPVDEMKRPDLSALLAASRTVGQVISAGDVVVFESTVYPGATEDDCIPIIETLSGLTCNRDFFAGYSPERINPGDKKHRLRDIVKVTSGSTPEAAVFVDALYGSIITAGTYLAPSIRVAEAAKVIENTQRDVNIALVNELAVIFKTLGLDTLEVLEAAGTKWNFLPFRPGLVGGHCIGVDPYYLTYKAQSVGLDPKIVLAGRHINDSMGTWIARDLIRTMIANDVRIKGARVLIWGLTFKEDVPDLRNTRVIDIMRELESYGVAVDVYDPLVTNEGVEQVFGRKMTIPLEKTYAALVLAVPHAQIRQNGSERLTSFLTGEDDIILDVKGALPPAPHILRI